MKIKQSDGTWEDFPLPISIGDFGGASSSTKGSGGTVPAPAAGDQAKFLRGDGQWALPNVGNVTVDTAISSSSTNPIQNKIIKAEIDKLNTSINAKTAQQNWTASIKCATWSRLCYIAFETSVVGSSFILNVAATRGNVVYNETFAINVNHSQKATIAKIGTANYSSIQLRTISDSNGNCYVELYDAVNSATNTTAQSVYCRLVAIRTGAITTYTTFTDGSTLPANFISSDSITTNGNSLQGNLTWSEITDKPNYAGSSSAGGSATSAVKLDTATTGSATQPVYFANGIPVATTYTLGASVPSGAKFTDTVYTHPSTHPASMITGLATVATSGKYSDLSGTPTSLPANGGTAAKLSTNAGSVTQPVYFTDGVPTACTYTLGKSVPSDAKFTDTVYTLPDATASVKGGIKVGSNLTVSSGVLSLSKANVTAALGYTPPTTNTTYSNMTAATASAAGKAGLVPAPAAGAQGLYLRGDGTWAAPTNTAYTHPNSGVTAGTYRSVTVNAQGHVTAASNPTISIAQGGTGATTAEQARKNLGIEGIGITMITYTE